MIHPGVRFKNLNMTQVRRFIDLASIAGPTGSKLYVLHEEGIVRRAWHTLKGRIDLTAVKIEPSLEFAARLASQHEADDVELIDLLARDRFLSTAQDLNSIETLNGPDQRLRVHDLKQNKTPGIIIYPKRDLFDLFMYSGRTREYIKEKLQPDCVYLLGVFEGTNWWSSGVVHFEKGLVVSVESFDVFQGSLAQVMCDGAMLAQEASRIFNKPAYAHLLSRESFENFARHQWSGFGQVPLAFAQP